MTDTYPSIAGDETHRRSASATIEPSTPVVAAFLANVRYHDLSPETVERTKALFLDWLGSALAGATSEPIAILRRFARAMGPSSGPATLVPPHETSSAFFAALVNGASSHVVEMDDLHNGAVVHPGTVVFPAAFAAAQDLAATGRNLSVSVVVGYEACLRVGEYLGRSHYRVFHTRQARRARSAPRPLSPISMAPTPRPCGTPWAQPAHRRPASGRFCGMALSPSSCMRAKQRRMGCSPPTWRATASRRPRVSWRDRPDWMPRCRRMPT